MANPSAPDQAPRTAWLGLDRLNALSDGVIAIVITILVLGIEIPDDHRFTEQGLLAFLRRTEHDLLAYAVSFWLVAAYWIQHHAVYHYIHHADRALVWLNLLFLFPITLLPFATNLKGAYEQEPLAVVLFGGTHVACGLTLAALCAYAIRRPHLLHTTLDPRVAHRGLWLILAGVGVNLVAIVVSFWSMRIGTLVFLALPLLSLSSRNIDTHSDAADSTTSS